MQNQNNPTLFPLIQPNNSTCGNHKSICGAAQGIDVERRQDHTHLLDCHRLNAELYFDRNQRDYMKQIVLTGCLLIALGVSLLIVAWVFGQRSHGMA